MSPERLTYPQGRGSLALSPAVARRGRTEIGLAPITPAAVGVPAVARLIGHANAGPAGELTGFDRDGICAGRAAEEFGRRLCDEGQILPHELAPFVVGHRRRSIRGELEERSDRIARDGDGANLAVDPHVDERAVADRSYR